MGLSSYQRDGESLHHIDEMLVSDNTIFLQFTPAKVKLLHQPSILAQCCFITGGDREIFILFQKESENITIVLAAIY